MGYIGFEPNTKWQGGLGHHIQDLYNLKNFFKIIGFDFCIYNRYINTNYHYTSDNIFPKIINEPIMDMDEKAFNATQYIKNHDAYGKMISKVRMCKLGKYVNHVTNQCSYVEVCDNAVKKHNNWLVSNITNRGVIKNGEKVNIKTDLNKTLFKSKNKVKILVHVRRGDASDLNFSKYEISKKFKFLKEVDFTQYKFCGHNTDSKTLYDKLNLVINEKGLSYDDCEIVLISNGFPDHYIKWLFRNNNNISVDILKEIKKEFMDREYSIFKSKDIKMHIKSQKSDVDSIYEMISSYIESDIFIGPKRKSLLSRVYDHCIINNQKCNFPECYYA
jgi:hypothetical protein